MAQFDLLFFIEYKLVLRMVFQQMLHILDLNDQSAKAAAIISRDKKVALVFSVPYNFYSQ